jgi:hypothetical protein
MSETRTKTKRARRPEGLIGLFGHTYFDGVDGDPALRWQFQIIRRMRGDRYVVQLFSFMDGEPTEVTVLTEAELLGPHVKLYATRELWHLGYEKYQAKWGWKTTAKRPRASSLPLVDMSKWDDEPEAAE